MAFDPKKLLDVARLLLSESVADLDDGARSRSAISRAYYAAFLHARAVVERDGGRVRGGGDNSHNDVWDFLESDMGSGGESIGQQGRNLKKSRQIADYRLDLSVKVTNAAFAICSARRLLRDLDALPSVTPTPRR